MNLNTVRTQRATEQSRQPCAAFLTGLGAGLLGVSFFCGSRTGGDSSITVDPPTLSEAVMSPRNIAPGIALISVSEEDMKDTESIIEEFEHIHPDIRVLGSQPHVESIINVGKRFHVKVVYEFARK